ncbi:MAG: hypothetical protein JWR73_1881 [Tardiphaga sp.]|nr:hypothetical protein [Tardiphaga sp.]
MTRSTIQLHACMLAALLVASAAQAQGLVQGVEQGARDGNRAAGPVGGVLGGAIGGVVGIVGGVLGVPASQPQKQPAPSATAAPSNDRPPATPSKAATTKSAKETGKAETTKTETGKAAKATPGPRPAGAPAALAPSLQPLTAEQIVAASDANIARIKSELKLTPEQDKHWGGFNSAMHYLGHNGAARLNLRIARAKRDPPDDIVEQMRNEAQFLNDRAVDQRAVADAAEPLFGSLDDRQKAIFVSEMVKLSRERGLD